LFILGLASFCAILNNRFLQYDVVFLIFYLFIQYPHLYYFIFDLFMHYPHPFYLSFIFLCNTFIMYRLTFIQNINSHISFFAFVILVSNVVVHPPITLEGVHWAKDGAKFACKVHGCNDLHRQVQLGMAFVNATQCDYGARQAVTCIYLKGGPKASRSHGHECVGLEKPFGLISSQ
jgi:hypothetical protein